MPRLVHLEEGSGWRGTEGALASSERRISRTRASRPASRLSLAGDGTASRWSLPAEGVPQAVGDQVERQHGQHDGQPGKDERPRSSVDELETLLEHAAPARCRRLFADTEEAEARLGQECEAEGERELNDDG